MRHLLIALVLVLAGTASAELAPIQLDGYFDDWTALTPVFTDPAGDDGSSGIDWQRVWVANDQDYLYIRFETTADIQSDENPPNPEMVLYLDTDMNAGTGISYGGIGAELMWEFAWRNGEFTKGTDTTVYHDDVGLMCAPTTSSTEFEIALARDAIPANGQALFSGGTVRFILRDPDGGDVCPGSGSISYTFVAGDLPVPSIPLQRDDPAHIRVATWNIQNDGLFDGGTTEDAQDRILDAIDPDVLVINEVWSHSASQVRNQIEQLLPSGAGETWYAVGDDGGNVLVSRFPILDSWEVSPGDRITAALLDIGPDPLPDMLVIANHWSCCTADANRQDQADANIEFLADAKTPGGRIDLPEGTPIVLAGDLNLVGLRRQLVTIQTGDILDEGTYGPDMAPDWDGSPFAHPLSRQPDARRSDTWFKDFSTYYPGMLDWIFYTDSALDLHNHYVLDTRFLAPATLSTNQLLQNDIDDASDHAPRVADFTVFNPNSPVPGRQDPMGGARLLPNVPNPFNPRTEIRFALENDAVVELAIYDARGQRVAGFSPERFAAGSHGTVWDGADAAGRPAASGVYRVMMTVTESGRTTVRERAVTLLK